MPKPGPTPQTRQAAEEFRKVIKEILPIGISIDIRNKEIEERIYGYIGDVEACGPRVLEKVTRLLGEIEKARNSN